MEKTLPFALILHTSSSSSLVTSITMEHLYDKFRKLTNSASYNVRLQICEQVMTREQYNLRLNNFFSKYSTSDIDLFNGTSQDIMMRDIGEIMKLESKDNFSVIKSDIAGLVNIDKIPPKIIFFNVIGNDDAIENFFVALFTKLNAEKCSNNKISLYPVVLTLTSDLKEMFNEAFSCDYSLRCQIGILV